MHANEANELSLTDTRCTQATAERLAAQLQLLRSPGPTIKGAAVAGVPGVPPHLRGLLIAQLHVLCRLRGDTERFDTPEQLVHYLSVTCDGLLARLHDEWWEGGWAVDEAAGGRGEAAAPGGEPPPKPRPMLRHIYSKAMQNAWLRAGVVE